ncbi:hypothetical protein EON81_22135 [bacterium]|nr:MAG: hypothetical protein EON81_22135 [bacterium]
MPGLKNWMLGKHLTSLNLYGGTKNLETGAVTWEASPVTLLKRVDYVRVTDQRMLDMIASVDATHANYELTLLDSALVVGEIMKRDNCVLALLAQNFTYVKTTFTRGKGTYTHLGIIQTDGDGIVAYGKNTAEMTLAQADVDATGAPLVYTETA